ncbi:hypothetical protein BU14_0985s0004 [Porphyra umbilicalis]|uniref:Uncharacterized protein n=1 Tax=Porphyra umbilicalis TaxID=2786 RepID=A0A1X6NN07_PORUM|nr:hypothetical protein BU14_0985s0004 [Porphyra umbilicalis]|eukprot:OSX69952.1 hypothetical protein BU14_0985s0004 [Porphyra umbilicalis]
MDARPDTSANTDRAAAVGVPRGAAAEPRPPWRRRDPDRRPCRRRRRLARRRGCGGGHAIAAAPIAPQRARGGGGDGSGTLPSPHVAAGGAIPRAWRTRRGWTGERRYPNVPSRRSVVAIRQHGRRLQRGSGHHAGVGSGVSSPASTPLAAADRRRYRFVAATVTATAVALRSLSRQGGGRPTPPVDLLGGGRRRPSPPPLTWPPRQRVAGGPRHGSRRRRWRPAACLSLARAADAACPPAAVRVAPAAAVAVAAR